MRVRLVVGARAHLAMGEVAASRRHPQHRADEIFNAAELESRRGASCPCQQQAEKCLVRSQT